MRANDYGTSLEQALRDSPEPLTASDLRDVVGCSRQRVYTWLQSNQHRITEAGKDRHGGTRYLLRSSAPIMTTVDYALSNESDVDDGDVAPGSVLTVRRVSIDKLGRVNLMCAAANGMLFLAHSLTN